MASPTLSLILPIYNQYDNLGENFDKIYASLKRDFGPGNFEIVFIDDGSKDKSWELEKQYAKKSGVVLLPPKKNGGRGSALKVAIPKCRGRVIGFIDTDLAVPMKYVKPAVEKVLEGNQMVIGSKYIKGAHYTRKPERLLISRVGNGLVSFVLGTGVTDHVSGFKFIEAGYIKKNVKQLKDNDLFFDVEMIVRARRNGATIYEIPVEWSEKETSTLSTSRIIKFMKGIVKMRLGLM